MKEILNSIIDTEYNKETLKEKITHYLVYKKKRGTYQALEEATIIEKELRDVLEGYIHNWFTTETCMGVIRDLVIKEYKTQLLLELSRRGLPTEMRDYDK